MITYFVVQCFKNMSEIYLICALPLRDLNLAELEGLLLFQLSPRFSSMLIAKTMAPNCIVHTSFDYSNHHPDTYLICPRANSEKI